MPNSSVAMRTEPVREPQLSPVAGGLASSGEVRPEGPRDVLEAPKSRLGSILGSGRSLARKGALLAGGGGAAAAFWTATKAAVETGVILGAPVGIPAAIGVGALAAGVGLRYLLRDKAPEAPAKASKPKDDDSSSKPDSERHVRRGGPMSVVGRAAGAAGAAGFLGGMGLAGYALWTAGAAAAAFPPMAIAGAVVALGSALGGGILHKMLASRGRG